MGGIADRVDGQEYEHVTAPNMRESRNTIQVDMKITVCSQRGQPVLEGAPPREGGKDFSEAEWGAPAAIFFANKCWSCVFTSGAVFRPTAATDFLELQCSSNAFTLSRSNDSGKLMRSSRGP